MNKSELRKYFKEKRSSISDKESSRLDDLILIQFQQWVIPDYVQTLLSYWPMRERGEVNTFLFSDFMSFRIPSLQVAYPVIDNKSSGMRAVEVNYDTDFALNDYGIAEPVNGNEILPGAIDMVIVPLLAFDRDGYRLGYGKGFYDRYLARCSETTVKLGFSYFDPILEIPGKDEFDIPLTVCITPEKIYEF